jgi:hypothetical protein
MSMKFILRMIILNLGGMILPDYHWSFGRREKGFVGA